MNINHFGSLFRESKVFVTTILCFLVVVNIHCSQKNRGVKSESKIIVHYSFDERILGPYWNMEARFLVFLPLISMDDFSSLELVPALAERWEHSPDYREWTFWLNKDLRWHDGVPVTAHDIKFTRDLWSHSARVGETQVLDDFTFKITFEDPTHALDYYQVYYPKHLLEGLDPKGFLQWEFWTQPIGNGPYRYVRHIPKIMIELEANPDYFRGKPKIDRVIFKFAGSPTTELLSGSVDVAAYSGGGNMRRILSGETHYRFYYSWSIWLNAIHWNHSNPLFQDASVRKALTLAINRRELAQVLNYPEDVPITDVLASWSLRHAKEIPDPLPYDPESAKNILEEAGWRDANGNGIREKEGKEFHFTVICPGGYHNQAVYVQSQLHRVGVRMEIQTLELSVVRQRLRSRNFDAVIFRFGNPEMGRNGTSILSAFGEYSNIGYSNPELIHHLDLLTKTVDPDEFDHRVKEIMPILQRDIPITFLLPKVHTHIAHSRIKGLSNHFRPNPVWFMEYLWIEEEDKK